MFQEIGKVNETRSEVSVEWKINNIELLWLRKNVYYTSPPFFLSDSCWNLKIRSWFDELGHTSAHLLLFREDFGPTKNVTFTLGYKEEDRMVPILCRQGYAFSKSNCFDFISNCNIQTKLTTGSLIPNPPSTLTVMCTIKSEAELPLEVSLFRRLWNLSLSLREIFSRKQNTDFQLKLKDLQIDAHSIILKSRYPDFVSKFADEVGELNIEDSDQYAFNIVVFYLYSGEPKGLSSENVWAVYRIARECNLQELKKLCTMFLKKNLSVDDVCDILVKATEYQETELKNHAKEFFAKNSSQILRTHQWKSFSRDHCSLLQEIMEHMMQELSTVREELIQMKLHVSETKKS